MDLLALISPGPNFILTTTAAVSKSRHTALWTACGIATGSFVWAAAAALGIASVLETFPLLAFGLKILGSAYLVMLGVKLLMSRGFEQSSQKAATASGINGFCRGFIVNISNPKSAAYYASVFAAFLTPDMPAWVLVFLIVCIAAMSLSWHVIVAVSFSATHMKAKYISASKSIDRLCDGVIPPFSEGRISRI
ncbi:MAG: LysE family transporter [Pseudomonadota bacterium]